MRAFPRPVHGLLLLSMLLCLPSCRTAGPVQIKVVEKPVPVQVKLDPQLTRTEPAPPRPALTCRDANGAWTLCNSALADWLNAYDAALARLNARMEQIIGLQPKGAP
jgi:hypothetical protein